MKNIIEHLERLSLSYKNIKLYPLIDKVQILKGVGRISGELVFLCT